MSYIKRKKGQITIFVILGLLLLAGVGVYIYLTTRVNSQILNVPRLTGDSGQVQTFVEGCIDQVGREGITMLGMHGGYIDPLDKKYTPITITSNKLKQTESDMVFVNSLDESTGVPYWYYSKSRTGCWHCDVSSLTPTVPLMEAQLGKYVDDNLDSCLDNFSTFKQQGFEIKSLSNTATSVMLSDNSVNFLTNYSIQIIRNGEANNIELFYKEVDIPLLKYYVMATNITQNEINNEYLDTYALYIIGQYNGMDGKKLPPISAYRTGYDPIFWSKMNTKMMYQSLLSSYTPFFRIVGTKNDVNITSRLPLESNMYSAMRLSMFNANDIKLFELSDKEINYIYLGQPIYFDVNPSNGDLISPFVTKDTSIFSKAMMNVAPDQNYDFFYDVSYPVIVEIKDDRPGKEYKFMFALQGNIKENKLLSDWLVGLGTIPWNEDYVSIYNNIPNGTTVVDEETGENVSYTPIESTKNFFCDNAQRLSGNIKLKTYDSVTSQPLSGVSLTYYCGTYASCYLDVTRFDKNNDASFNGNLPLCLNGYIDLEKDGYMLKRMSLTTESKVDNNIGSVYLDPIFTKNITVKKYSLSRVGNNYDLGQVSNLSSNDSVLLTVSKVSSDNLEQADTQTLIIGKNGYDTAQLDLVPGVYEVNAQLLDYNGITIPKECQAICVDSTAILKDCNACKYISPITSFLATCKKFQKIPSDDIKMDVAMQGGIDFNDTNPLIVTWGDLLSNNSLELYVVRMPNPRCLGDMNEPTLTGYFSKKYRNVLIPKFIPSQN